MLIRRSLARLLIASLVVFAASPAPSAAASETTNLSVASGWKSWTSHAAPGHLITWTVSFANHGAPAFDIEVDFPIPAGLTFVSAGASTDNWDVTAPSVGSDGTIRFQRDSVIDGANLHFSVVLRVAAAHGAYIEPTASVTASTPDHYAPDNNTFAVVVVDNGAPPQSPSPTSLFPPPPPNPATPDLTAHMWDVAEVVVPGDRMTIAVSVINNGGDASGVELTYVPPSGTHFLAAQEGSQGWSVALPPIGSAEPVVFRNTGSVLAATGAGFKIQLAVDPQVPDGTALRHETSVSTSAQEVDLSDNVAEATTTTRVEGADLGIWALLPPAGAGQLPTLDVFLENHGPTRATDVTFTVNLPKGTYVPFRTGDVISGSASWTSCEWPDHGDDGGTLVCRGGHIEPGTLAKYHFNLQPIVAPVGPQTYTATASVTSTTPDPGPSPNWLPITLTAGAGPVSPVSTATIVGADRVDTAVRTSQDAFPTGDAVGAVVLARSDGFADALAGAPLAAKLDAPLLLTGTSDLDPRVQAEIARVLAPGGTVHLLGGPAALSRAVESRLEQLGLAVMRYAGVDRYGTAVDIARRGLGSPGDVVLATGNDFADALAAGAAAAHSNAAVLLTAGRTMPSATSSYLSANPGWRVALGGPAAAAAPAATAIVGVDRFDTAVRAAFAFFGSPTVVGVASGSIFADALAGGADMARRGGPLVLTAPAVLPGATRSGLAAAAPTLDAIKVYGGPAAISDAVVNEIHRVMRAHA